MFARTVAARKGRKAEEVLEECVMVLEILYLDGELDSKEPAQLSKTYLRLAQTGKPEDIGSGVRVAASMGSHILVTKTAQGVNLFEAVVNAAKAKGMSVGEFVAQCMKEKLSK